MSLNQHPCRVSFQRENMPSRVTFRVHKWLTQKRRTIHHSGRKGTFAEDQNGTGLPWTSCTLLPLHTEPCCFQWFIYQEKGIEGEVNEAALSAAEVRPRREPKARIHTYTRDTQRGQVCFLLAACYKYYLSGQIFCFENSQIPRTASTHQSKRRGKKCQCFSHSKISWKQTRSWLFHG